MSICASLALLLIRIAHPRGAFLGKVRVRAEDNKESREVFVPLKQDGVTNEHIQILPPTPGVIVYRLEESYIYPNCSHLNSILVDYVKENTRRGKDMSSVKLSDRPWNDPGPKRGEIDLQALNNSLPLMHAVVLDFSSMLVAQKLFETASLTQIFSSQIDTTAIQSLIDARNAIERWADRPVEVSRCGGT